MGKVVKFPDKFLSCRRYRISLYTDFEVELVLAALNTYPECEKKYDADMLTALDPIFVRKALDFSIGNSIISDDAKVAIQNIINNMEEIPFDE
jgi:hypothetical protein